MADNVNANIRVNLDTSQALAGLQSLQSRISSFNQSVIQSNAQAVAAQRSLLSTLQSQIGASGQFATSITNVEGSVSRLQTAIDKNKLSMGQYFRYGIASSKNFGRVFAQENEQITRLATERVRRLQTQYIALGESQQGMTKALQVRPLQLFNADMAIATQKSQLFNKLLQDGSTSLVNWGKNTQWAGRQLMVGFTVPLTIFGGVAAKIFMDLEKEAINFRKVYGDIFTTEMEVEENLAAVREISKEMTKYGIAVKDTMALAGVAAQSGLRSADLMAATEQATRLAVLGQMEQAEAMETVISMQTAFQQSNEELAQSVDFLNIIENQTVLSLQDVAGAIPRAAPVIQGLGGDVKDLAVLLVAMREGGVSAAEGANALKNSLARLITPTSAASGMARDFGINLEGIVERNKGQVLPTIMELANAMKSLEDIDQQRLLSTIFGKFQYARIGALFKNITNDSSQAARAIELMGMSTEELAQTADQELSVVEDAIGVKFTGAVELLKAEIAPIGEQFLKLATPIVEFATKIFEKFNNLSPTVKNFVTILTAGIGVILPAAIMLLGLFGNLIGSITKGVATIIGFFTRLRNGGEAVQYLSGAQLDAAAAAGSLEGQINGLTGSLNIQREAVDALSASYRRYVAGANAAAANLPQGFRRPATTAPLKMARGGLVPGTGNEDSVPALLMPGESVVTKEATQKFAPIIDAMNKGTLQGFAKGMTGRVSFGNLGNVELPSVYNQASLASIQQMADDLSNAGDDVRMAFKSILEDLSQTQNLTKGMVQESQQLKQSQFPEISGMAGERKYSASKAGERRGIEQQLREDLAMRANNEQLIQQEYARAQAAADGAAASINSYYDDLVASATTQEEINDLNRKRAKQVEEASRIDRAHMVELTNAQKLERESWNARLWMPQSGIENQLSNMLATSENNRVIYEQYLMDLADTSVTEQQKQQILEKVRKNIALTDTELDIQAQVLQRIVDDARENAILVQKANGEFAKISPQFGAYATGAIGAARGRAAMGAVNPAVEAQRIAMSQGVIGGLRDDWETASPSESAARVSEEVPRGVAKGIKRATPQAVAAAKEMAQEVEGQIAMEFEDDDALFPAAPYRGERRLQESRPSVVPSGATTLPIVSADKVKNATQKFSNETNQAAKRMSGLKTAATKFGGALKNGSMKMQGAFFALDGVVLAASMMDNSFGKIAQVAMPVIFGLQGLHAVIPMLSNPIGLLVAAVGAAAAGLFILKNKYDEGIEKQINHSIALDGSARALNGFAEELGKVSPVDRFNQIISGVVSKKQEESLTRGQEILESETGKKFLEQAEMLAPEERLLSLQNQMNRMLAFNIFTPEDAIAVSKALGLALGDPYISNQLITGIYENLGKNKQILKSAFDQVFESTLKDVEDGVNSFTASLQKLESAQDVVDPNAMAGMEVASLDAAAAQEELRKATERYTISDNERAAAIATSLNNMQKISEAQAYLNMQYRQGNIDLQEYNERTKTLTTARDAIVGVFTTLREQVGLGSAEISKNIKTTALAMGILEEDFSKIEDQVRAVEDVLSGAFENIDVQPISDALQLAMLAGDVTAGEVAGLTAAATSGPLQATVELLLSAPGAEASVAQIIDLIQTLANVPGAIRRNIELGFETGEYNLDDIDRLVTSATRFADLPSVSVEAFFNVGGATQEELTRAESFYNEIRDNPNLFVNISTDQVDLESLLEVTEAWDKLGEKKNLNKKAVVELKDQFTQNANKFDFTWNQLNSLPDIIKQAVLLELRIQADLQLKIEGLSADIGMSGGGDAVTRQARAEAMNAVNESIKNIQNMFDIGQTAGADAFDKEEKGGGGKEKETPVKDFKDAILEQLRLYTDINTLIPKLSNQKKLLENVINELGFNNNLVERMRAANLSEEVIADLLSKGSRTAEKIFKSLEDRGQLGTFNLGQATATVGQAVLKNVKEANQARKALVVQNKLVASGIDEETAANIASNEALAESLFYIKSNTSAWNQFVKSVLEVEDATESIDILRDKIQELTRKRESEIRPIQQKIDAQQEVVDGIQSEIDAIQERNETDQNIIRDKQRQVEMIERQIDAVERLNESDERRIESLNRESELRDRVSEALSRELDKMSEVEDEIRDAYQKRIDALDKVASINDYIIDQQRQQLDLSRAVSEGDVYAATAAAQAMRAASSGFAVGQVRSALEQGMEGQIAGLRTSEGLTREEAEQRIADIAEQNYQTSLKIRDIEDAIYERNLSLIPLKDQIQSINDQIVIVEDRIYERETQILNITNNKLKPQQAILDKLNDEKEAREKLFEEQLDALQIAKDIEDGVISQGENVNALADAWYEVAKQIRNAKQEAAGKLSALTPPDPSDFKRNEKYEQAYARWEKKRAAIIAERDRKVAEQLAIGNSALDSVAGTVNAYAGGMIEKYGMGGKIKRYRGGGVVSNMQSLGYGGSVLGSGGRDSVPAMLMPGEFVVRKAMVKKYGESMMKDINLGSFAMPKYNMGVETQAPVVNSASSVSNINAPVYNTYDMKFSINGTNQSADEIANKVMFKMRQIQDQGIRNNRGY